MLRSTRHTHWLYVTSCQPCGKSRGSAFREPARRFVAIFFQHDEGDSNAQVPDTHIEKVLSGCAVMEHWHGAGGSEGKSLFFVTGEGRWKQVWATEWATRPGGVKEKDWQELDEPGQARFQGRIMLPDGRSYLDRTTLIRLPSGDVRQVIEHSTDDGVTWESGFDATYRRRN
jgi:hypothetical protein